MREEGSFLVTPEEAGMRLDKVLSGRLLHRSRSELQRLIKSGDVLVDGRERNAHYVLSEGEKVNYHFSTSNLSTLVPEDIPLDVVYEDEDILVVNKPRGLSVHPGAGHPSGTLANALMHRYGRLPQDEEGGLRPGLVHRIDKDTTGLLCIAKSERAFRLLQEEARTHRMRREYLALVLGRFPGKEGHVDLPIGRKEGDPLRFAVRRDGKPSVTDFEVIEEFRGHSLLRLRLKTGRTHQIRVHMEAIGHPVEGDPLYGKGNRTLFDKGQLLHAARLSLVHPEKGEMSFEAPLPGDFEEVLATLRGRGGSSGS